MFLFVYLHVWFHAVLGCCCREGQAGYWFYYRSKGTAQLHKISLFKTLCPSAGLFMSFSRTFAKHTVVDLDLNKWYCHYYLYYICTIGHCDSRNEQMLRKLFSGIWLTLSSHRRFCNTAYISFLYNYRKLFHVCSCLLRVRRAINLDYRGTWGQLIATMWFKWNVLSFDLKLHYCNILEAWVSNYRSNISAALQKHKYLQKPKTENQNNFPENLALEVLHVFSITS